MGLFSIFGTSLRAINAYSGALSVIANNVANSSNENYSRQIVSFSSLPPDNLGGVETGRGIQLGDVSQEVNDFLELRLTDSTYTTERYGARAEFLRMTDSVFQEFGGAGLNVAIADFFDAWTALSAEPESTAQRNNVLQIAEAMGITFDEYSTALADMREKIDKEIQNLVPLINDKLEEIRDINQQILDSTTGGLSFKDDRRKAINELAEMIDIQVVESGDEIQIYTKAGNPMLTGVTMATFSTQIDVTNDNLSDVYLTLGGSSTDITSTMQQGRIAGLISVRDTELASYQDTLDTLAYTLVTEINTLHLTGFDQDGNTGTRFFTNLASSAGAAGLITLNASVDNDPRGIAVASSLATIQGGNTIGRSIADLGDSTSITFGAVTNSFLGYFGDLLADVGADTRLAENSENFQDSVHEQIKLERIQTSGVNIDEEEINLTKFQAALNASGRLIAVADSILTTLIEALGG